MADRKYTKEYYDKDTWGWYAIPYIQYIVKNNVDLNYNDRCSLRYCEKCDKVYESIWMGGKYKYYKLYIYPHFPKTQKHLVCPKCKGKKS